MHTAAQLITAKWPYLYLGQTMAECQSQQSHQAAHQAAQAQPTDTLPRPSVLLADSAVAQSARVYAFFGCALCGKRTPHSSRCQKYIKLQGPNVFRCYARLGCFGQMLESIQLICTLTQHLGLVSWSILKVTQLLIGICLCELLCSHICGKILSSTKTIKLASRTFLVASWNWPLGNSERGVIYDVGTASCSTV